MRDLQEGETETETKGERERNGKSFNGFEVGVLLG